VSWIGDCIFESREGSAFAAGMDVVAVMVMIPAVVEASQCRRLEAAVAAVVVVVVVVVLGVDDWSANTPLLSRNGRNTNTRRCIFFLVVVAGNT